VTVNLEQLAGQVGFRLGPPLRERIAYREMFPFGLTLADLSANLRPAEISTPRRAAREELKALLVALNLELKALLVALNLIDEVQPDAAVLNSAG